MYPYLGDFNTGATIFFPFQTFNSSGASVTLTGLAVTDIEVYKGASMTQRSSDAGYALVDTDGIDIDTITGIHGFTIDTSDNTDAGFYAAGSDYTVVISAVTVDSQTVNFIAGRFSILNRAANVTHFGGTAGTFSGGRPEVNVSHWLGTAAATPTTAGVPEVDITFIAGAAVSTTTAQLGVNVVQISGDAAAADNVETTFDDTAGPVRWQLISDQGTLQAVGSTSSVTLAATASAEDDVYNGQTIHFPTATLGSKQSTFVSDYNGTTKVATLSPALAVALTGTVTYKIGATAAGTSPVSANVTQWNGSAVATPTVAGVPEVDVTHWIGTAAATPTVAGVPEVDVTHYLGAASPALVGGRFDASVGAMAASVMTAAAAAADLTTELQSGLATAAALDTVDNLLDTEIAAIKTVVDAIQAKTDSLTFTVAGVVDAGVYRINGVAVIGAGTAGNLWRA
jgi:hypothetical protein